MARREGERLSLLLTQVEAAEELGISRDILRGLVMRGEIGIVLVGKDERIPAAELRRWVRRNTIYREAGTRVSLPPAPSPKPRTSGMKAEDIAAGSTGRSRSDMWRPSKDNGEPTSPSPVVPIRS